MSTIVRLLAALLVTAGCLLAGPGAGWSAAAPPGQRPDPAGSWVWPLRPLPDVVAPFVPPANPYGPGHRGADLAGTVGQPVLAVAAGRVGFAGQVAGRGVVVVDHGRLRTTYEPVLVAVRRGDRIEASEPVGTLTLAGGHCLPLACCTSARATARRTSTRWVCWATAGSGCCRSTARCRPFCVPHSISCRWPGEQPQHHAVAPGGGPARAGGQRRACVLAGEFLDTQARGWASS